MSTKPGRRAIGAAGAAVLVLVGLTGQTAVHAACYSAEVDAPVLLPGGVEVGAGTLTICMTRDLSPVSALHKTYIDGRPVAMIISRRGYSEGTGDGEPFLVFERDPQGRLQLYGFARPAGARMATYTIGLGKSSRSDRERSELLTGRQARSSAATGAPLPTVIAAAAGGTQR